MIFIALPFGDSSRPALARSLANAIFPETPSENYQVPAPFAPLGRRIAQLAAEGG